MYNFALETENEIDRVFRDMEFFEARRELVFFEVEREVIIPDGITNREISKKKLKKVTGS